MPIRRRARHAGPKPDQGERTREELLAAAARVFSERGLAGARMDGIASEAGVNKALIYYYFGGKERLYAAVFDEHFREFNARALEVLGAPGSARAALLRYVELHFDSISRSRNSASLHQHFMTAGRIVQPLVMKYAKPRGDALAKLLERGMREGEFRVVDVRHTLISITSLIVHYFSIAPILRQVSPIDAYSPQELARRRAALLDLIRHGLFVHPESPVP